jgi:hypothetical protein
LATALILAGCATTEMNAQWTNPEYQGRSLRGQSVLIACQARDFTMQQVCEDQMAAQLSAKGIKAVRLAPNDPSAGAPGNDALIEAAKKAGATAFTRIALSVSAPVVGNTGPQIGIGVGGGGGGGGRYGGVGGGISFPIGGSSVTEALAADTTVVAVPGGALVWSGRATTPTGSNTAQQLTDLAKVTTEAMQSAGLLK